MHVAIALLPNGRSRANNNSHNNRNVKRLPRAAWSLCSTGARLMQTNAKFTTGKLSTARWLRDRERLNLNRNQNQNQNLKSETGMGNGNSHFGGCGNCSQRCTLLLLLLLLLYHSYTAMLRSANANLISGGLNVSVAVHRSVSISVSKFLIVGNKFKLAA